MPSRIKVALRKSRACRYASPLQKLPERGANAVLGQRTSRLEALRAAYDGGRSRTARAPVKTPPAGAAPLWRMESKGEGKYDDDDDDAKSGSTRDAKSESKDQDEQDDALLRRVFDWYYEDEDLEAELQKFAFDHAQEFEDECSASGEYSLEHTELHREFRSIFERRLEECVERHGSTVQKFYRLVAADQARSTELYSGHTFAAVINSTMSFESFYELMRDAKRGDFYWGVPLLQDMDTLEFLF